MRKIPRDAAIGQCVLFWDYDTQWGADRSRAPGGPKTWGHLDFEHTERLLQLLADHELRACFAVVGAAALPGPRPYHDPMQIRRIHQSGHEVASHSFRHEWLPGIGSQGLRETLCQSKRALEECIGAEVTAFVPPFNQPFDLPRRWSWSISERRQVRRDRIDGARLCEVLGETGYRFCRISYRTLAARLRERVSRRTVDAPVSCERIRGITCLRLNTPGGFSGATAAMLARCAEDGGTVVAYGHPHSLANGRSQDERWLVPFLRELRELSRAGRIRVRLPRDLVQ